jgi:hypothetical protein
MLAILHLLVMFVADIFKSRRRLEAENLFLRHQLNIALRRAPLRLRLHGSDRALLVWLTFLAGYGAAQAVPGPLFTFAAYLGKLVNVSPHGVPGAALALIGIFLPGILILLGTLPFWDSFRKRASAQATMRGVNAAVV